MQQVNFLQNSAQLQSVKSKIIKESCFLLMIVAKGNMKQKTQFSQLSFILLHIY